MLSKLLVTLAIIAAAALFLKQRSQAARHLADSSAAAASGNTAEHSGSGELRFAAYLFLTLMLGLGGVLFFQDWRESHKVVTIKLYRENAPEPVVYQAYRGELGERSFTTLSGVRVAVAGDERMELSGLED